LQLIGRAFDEEMLFSLAQVIEHAAPKAAWPERWWAQQQPHPLVGSMKGTVQVAPGVDLTDPADPEWGTNLER
jgi:hypothetical protein